MIQVFLNKRVVAELMMMVLAEQGLVRSQGLDLVVHSNCPCSLTESVPLNLYLDVLRPPPDSPIAIFRQQQTLILHQSDDL